MAEFAPIPRDAYEIERFAPLDDAPPFETNPLDADADEKPRFRLKVSPFALPTAASIPPRDVLFGPHYVRGYVTLTPAPGALGKTALVTAEAIAMTADKGFLGHRPKRPLRVLLVNLEDPLEEMQRRIVAICLHHRISAEDIGDRLFLVSGRDTPIVIGGNGPNGMAIDEAVVTGLVETIQEHKIDVAIFDPFVSLHHADENQNGPIDMIAKALGRVADRGRCAIHCVHHTRKLGGEAANVESARGAKALIDAARATRVLNAMTADEASRAGLDSPRGYFRVEDGKMNLAPASAKAKWFRLVSVDLGNGNAESPADHVGVVEPWTWPDAGADITLRDLQLVQRKVSERAGTKPYRKDSQSPDWVGNAVASALGLHLEDPADKAKAKALLKRWFADGALREVEGVDDKRNPRKCVDVGEWA